MSNKHKHADVIKAWADGAVIECSNIGANKWFTTAPTPLWFEDMEYRVKPKLYKLELELTEAESFVLACKINRLHARASAVPEHMEKFDPNYDLQEIGRDLYHKFDFEAMAAAFK